MPRRPCVLVALLAATQVGAQQPPAKPALAFEEVMIPVRDGVHLQTVILTPSDQYKDSEGNVVSTLDNPAQLTTFLKRRAKEDRTAAGPASSSRSGSCCSPRVTCGERSPTPTTRARRAWSRGRRLASSTSPTCWR